MTNTQSTKKSAQAAEEMLDEALAEPVLTGESRIPEAQAAAAAFLVLAVGAAAHINAWLPLRVEAGALLLHLAGAMAVFTLARRVLDERTELPAMACGILFAVHPLAPAAIQTGELRVLAGTLLMLLALALTLAASDAARPALDFRRAGLGMLLYTAASLCYFPLMMTALLVPLLHWVRRPVPVHSGMGLVYGGYTLLAAGLLVAMPYLTENPGMARAAWPVFTKNLQLLLGIAPMSVWHPEPVPAGGWLSHLVRLLIVVGVVALAVRARNAFGPALALVFLVAAAVPSLLPMDAVPLEAALYPTLAGLALAAGALAASLGRVPLLGIAGGVALTAVLAVTALSTYARNAVFIEPMAPLRAAVDEYPRHAAPRMAMARALYEQARIDMGADAFARGDAPVVLRAGDARSHLQAALRYTGEVVDEFEVSADAMLLQGKVLTLLGRHDEAAEDLFTALRMAPWRTEIARALGDAYAGLDGKDAARKAAEYYESASRRGPDDEETQLALVRHLQRSGMRGRLAVLDNTLIPDAQWHAVQELQRSDQQIRQSFQGDAFNPEGLTLYAGERIERGQPQLAHYALHEALRRAPDNAEAWGKLADLAVAAGAHDAFAAEFADTPAVDADQWETRAVRYASKGNWHAGAAFLRNTLPPDPEPGDYWLRLADLGIATDHLDEARDALEAARNAGASEDAVAQRQRRLDRPAE